MSVKDKVSEPGHGVVGDLGHGVVATADESGDASPQSKRAEREGTSVKFQVCFVCRAMRAGCFHDCRRDTGAAVFC